MGLICRADALVTQALAVVCLQQSAASTTQARAILFLAHLLPTLPESTFDAGRPWDALATQATLVPLFRPRLAPTSTRARALLCLARLLPMLLDQTWSVDALATQASAVLCQPRQIHHSIQAPALPWHAL